MRGPLVRGSLIFVGISLFELVPFVGAFGGVISLGVWIFLAYQFRTCVRVSAMSRAAIVGAATGFIGAAASLLFQVALIAAPQSSATSAIWSGSLGGGVLGPLGASIGLFLWPMFGIIVCGATGLIFGQAESTISTAQRQ